MTTTVSTATNTVMAPEWETPEEAIARCEATLMRIADEAFAKMTPGQARRALAAMKRVRARHRKAGR